MYVSRSLYRWPVLLSVAAGLWRCRGSYIAEGHGLHVLLLPQVHIDVCVEAWCVSVFALLN